MRALRVGFMICAIAGAAAASTTKTPPLFVYEEGGDTISFFSPKTVRILHGATADAGVRACQYELPDDGNMVSGPEVENAFRASTVQSELHARRGYTSTEPGKLTAGADSLEWSTTCRTNCATEPAAVQQFHTTLRTVMRNARLVCP